MRTVVNVKSGGRTPVSGMIHALLLLAILLGLGSIVKYVPLCVLAGILITVGWGIIDFKGFKDIARIPRSDAFVMLSVCVKDGDWDGAMMHWQRVGEKHSDRYKLMALYNEALYHEMVDSVGKSIDCLNKAMEYATTTAEQDSVKLKHWLDSYGSLDGYKFTDLQL